MKIVRATFTFNGRRLCDATAQRLRRHMDAADFAALTGAEPKLSRIPPAHWRNVYQYACPEMVDAEWARANGCEELAPGIWRSSLKHISREIAEQRGCEYAARQNAASGRRVVAYLRAEKFEGEGL